MLDANDRLVDECALGFLTLRGREARDIFIQIADAMGKSNDGQIDLCAARDAALQAIRNKENAEKLLGEK